MRWEDLLFMHWPVPAAVLRPLIPEGLELETFDGSAWIGVVPFRMCDTRLRYLFPMPTAGAFPELNVRTYVRQGGKHGVWFFSLDAASWIAVHTARRFFHLPYVHSRMSATEGETVIRYESERLEAGAAPAAFRARFRPTAEVQRSQPGSLAHWLTERYCLYSADRNGTIWRGEIHHEPWPLQEAEAEVELNTMTPPLKIELPDTQPILHFARRLDVVGWLIERVTR